MRPLPKIPNCCLPQESGPCLSPSLADHPLRSATDRRLGGPLPHQPANRPRAPPSAPCGFPPDADAGSGCGLSHPFGRVSPTEGQVTHVLLSRPPLPRRAVRLACFRHAASVDPEPGSNSPSLIPGPWPASFLAPMNRWSGSGPSCPTTLRLLRSAAAAGRLSARGTDEHYARPAPSLQFSGSRPERLPDLGLKKPRRPTAPGCVPLPGCAAPIGES